MQSSDFAAPLDPDGDCQVLKLRQWSETEILLLEVIYPQWQRANLKNYFIYFSVSRIILANNLWLYLIHWNGKYIFHTYFSKKRSIQ